MHRRRIAARGRRCGDRDTGRRATADRRCPRRRATGPVAARLQRGAHRTGCARRLERGGRCQRPRRARAGADQREQTDYRFPLAIYDGVIAKDVEVTVRFKAVAGRVDRAGGIAVRLTDADNYYVAAGQCAGGQCQLLSRRAAASRRQIHGSNAKVASDRGIRCSLKAVGDQFTIGFNDQTLFSVSDRTFGNAGKVALWTKADSVTRFANLTIRPLA